MSKTYKIKVNQGADSAKFVDIPQVGTSGKALTVKAVPGGKYQLMDASTGFAPENIRATRLGKDLQVFFEGRGQADLVIEDYYEVTPEGFNGLIGEAESGRFYEYIPESAVGNTAVPLLADGSTQVGMALGGAEINASGAAVGALVAAAGLNPLLLAPLALLGAAAGGGGSSTATPDTTPPVIKSAKLHVDDDTGAKDNVTSDKTPRISGETEANADVSVEVNGKTYTGKADANGLFVIQVPDADALADAFYTPKVTATDAAKNKSSVFDGTPFKVDSNSDGGGGSSTTDNKSATVKITKATVDTGVSGSDFVTKGPVTEFSGTLSNFTGTLGDKVKLELLDKDGKPLDPVIEGTVTPTALNGVWSWKWTPVDTDTTTNLPEVLKDGNYTLKATIVTSAGVAFTHDTASATQAVDIDTLPNEGDNKDAVLSITSVSDDTGTPNDWLTSDTTLVFKGTLNKFSTALGDLVMLELDPVAEGPTIVQYVTPVQDENGVWGWEWDAQKTPFSQGTYKLTATLVDKAGNVFTHDRAKAEKTLVIDTTGPQGDKGLRIVSMSVDSGVGSFNPLDESRKDFKTNDNTPEFTGTLNAALPQGEQIVIQLMKDGVVVESGFATVTGTGWKWAPKAPLADATYKLNAQVVDAVGNPATAVVNGVTEAIAPASKDVLIDTKGSTDTTDPNSKVVTTISIKEDTGESDKDFVTSNGGKDNEGPTFTGTLSPEFIKNGGKVLVQIVGSDGKNKSSAYVDPENKSWTYSNSVKLEDGQYVVKTILIDHVGNMISATDHVFYVDTTMKIRSITGKETITEISDITNFEMSEYGTYVFEGKTYSYFGGTLEPLVKSNKTYEAGTFKITFTDQAGNSQVIENNNQTWNFKTDNAKYLKESDLLAFTRKDFIDKSVGSMGKLTIDSNTFDMASLYDGITTIADQAVANHIVLDTKNVELTLSLGDVLALGVTNSFSVNSSPTLPHKGKIQMLIDGQDGDKLKLDGMVGVEDFDWTVPNGSSNTQLGFNGQTYNVYTHDGLGIALFVNTKITDISVL